MKRSNRNNSEYITICLSWRIFIAIFVFEDAELYAGNIIEFKNTVSKLCIYDIWCDCMRYRDADGGIIDRQTKQKSLKIDKRHSNYLTRYSYFWYHGD